jgi:hypothetical protein
MRGAVISALTGARPVRWGQVHLFLTRRRCHRKTVPGVTSRCARRLPGRCRISAASTARSAQSSRGRGWVRRSTATSCRSTSSSTSLKARERLNRTSQPQSRTKMRYSRRRNTADHHGPPPTPAYRRSSEAMQTIGTPQVLGEPENRPNLVLPPAPCVNGTRKKFAAADKAGCGNN